MGTIRELEHQDGTKSFHVIIRLRGHKTQYGTFPNKTKAKEWEQKTEAAIKEGRYFKTVEAQRHTVGELIDRFITQWLPKYPRRQAKQAALLTWWKQRLGHLVLADLTRSVIADARDALQAGITVRHTQRSSSTVNRYLAAFSKALTVAVKEWEWIEENPMRKVARPAEGRGRDRYLSLDEEARLLAACKVDSNPYLHPIVDLALQTGMRRGEILGLRWEDVDYEAEQITLQQTKNGERRRIPLFPEIRPTLEACKAFSGHTGLIFPPRRLGSVAADITTAFKRVCKRAGIENFRFHDCRHTAASFLAMDGTQQLTLMKLFGWKTAHMALRYAHHDQPHLAHALSRTASKRRGGQSSGEQNES